jgi:hypothetical protein
MRPVGLRSGPVLQHRLAFALPRSLPALVPGALHVRRTSVSTSRGRRIYSTQVSVVSSLESEHFPKPLKDGFEGMAPLYERLTKGMIAFPDIAMLFGDSVSGGDALEEVFGDGGCS